MILVDIRGIIGEGKAKPEGKWLRSYLFEGGTNEGILGKYEIEGLIGREIQTDERVGAV